MRFLITPEGRVGRCVVTRSSGHRGMDRETCRLMERRLRYRPARDMYGRPVAGWTEGEQEWFHRQEPDRWIEADIPDDS
jgi:protein TonB